MPGCLRTARHCVFTGGRLPPAGENRSCGKPPFLSAFPQGGFNPGGLWKTAARQIPVWKNAKPYAGANCKNKRKAFAFLFYKRQNAHIFTQKLPEYGGFHYAVYRLALHRMWKTRWKKWKTSLETAPLFHKNGGKPGGKSEKFMPERKLHTISGCHFGTENPHECCALPGFSTPRRLPCGFS